MSNSQGRLLIPKPKSAQKKFFVAALIAIALGIIIVAILVSRGVLTIPFFSQTQPETIGVNYGPPTAEELKETEAFKENQTKITEKDTTSNEPPQVTTVTPILTSWGQNSQTKAIEATGFIPGTYESGGVCTLKLALGEATFTESRTATQDAQTTNCGLISIPRDKLQPGKWTLTLSYESATTRGISNPNEVTVE